MIRLDENYTLANDKHQWILNFEKEGELNEKTGKPTVTRRVTYHQNIKQALEKYLDSAIKKCKSIESVLVSIEKVGAIMNRLLGKNCCELKGQNITSQTEDMKKYYSLYDKINGLLNLPSNWDSYNADKITEAAITGAKKVVSYLCNEGLLSPYIAIDVFPMRDGGIQFELNSEPFCGELEISFEGKLTAILFDDTSAIVHRQQIIILKELLNVYLHYRGYVEQSATHK